MKNYDNTFNKILEEVKKHQEKKDYKKFKKIDIHEHITSEPDFDKFLEVMDEFNIEKVLLMPSGGEGREREELVLKIQEKYPDKYVAFAFLKEVGKRAEKHLKNSIKAGAKGLKLLLWHPNIYSNNKLPMDSAEVWRIFEICSESKIPILAHMSIRSYPEHSEQLENTLKKFPQQIFIIPHYLGAAPRLDDIVSPLLDKYPNLYTDVSMGGGKNRYVSYIQGFRKTFRQFFKKYHNRLFWGTDLFIGPKSSKNTRFYHNRIKHDINLFDEKFFYSPFHEENTFLRGLNLSDKILNDVFYNNARRLLK